MGYERDRRWQAALCGEHYTLSLSSAAVVCTPVLVTGLYELQVLGDNVFAKSDAAAIAAIDEITDGEKCRFARDGGGIYFDLQAAGYIAAKRAGSTAVTIHVQRVG